MSEVIKLLESTELLMASILSGQFLAYSRRLFLSSRWNKYMVVKRIGVDGDAPSSHTCHDDRQ